MIVVGGMYSMTAPAQASPPHYIVSAQKRLWTRGYYRGPIDGRYNSRTRRALRNFQFDHGLAQTGRLNRKTCLMLGASCKTMQDDALSRRNHEIARSLGGRAILRSTLVAMATDGYELLCYFVSVLPGNGVRGRKISNDKSASVRRSIQAGSRPKKRLAYGSAVRQLAAGFGNGIWHLAKPATGQGEHPASDPASSLRVSGYKPLFESGRAVFANRRGAPRTGWCVRRP
jgi:peptidoglycan hydrolase-like protein with peptidoglycan-binding domain